MDRQDDRTAGATPPNPAGTHLAEEGLRHHRAGRLDQARAFYLEALAAWPDHADALHLLGLLDHQQGRSRDAVDLLSRAIAIRPDFPEALNNLGVALAATGADDDAEAAYRRAIALAPNFPEAHNNLGNTLRDRGRLDEAVAAYRQAVAIRPNYATAHHSLGMALARLDMFDEAAVAYRQAVAVKPDFAYAYADLATALKALGRFDEAAASLRQAIAFNPAVADWRSNLGVALAAMGEFDEAAGAFRDAVAIRPDLAQAHYNLANVLRDLGRHDAAIAAYRQAIAIRADYADAHGGLGLQLLLTGNLREGFEEYRWRWQASDFPETAPNLSCPLWEGESLSGKTILVHCEQGYGDSLHFIRYVRPLAQMAARVLVLTEPALEGLFRSIKGVEILTEAPPDDDRLDYRIPLLCLPRLFGADLDTVLSDVPYLAARASKIALWADRVANCGSGLKVGLVWAGDSRKHDPGANAIDRRRSISLQQLAPLAGVDAVRFVSLQKGEPSEQARHPPQGMSLVDMTAELHDFEDTAALVAHLDLVISVDTSVAHLAGALGKPVWLLNRFDPCWRWMLERDDSPWYPTLRQFRQPSVGDWNSVIGAVRDALQRLAAGDRTQLRPSQASPAP